MITKLCSRLLVFETKLVENVKGTKTNIRLNFVWPVSNLMSTFNAGIKYDYEY
jgi:hypothetical protein